MDSDASGSDGAHVATFRTSERRSDHGACGPTLASGARATMVRLVSALLAACLAVACGGNEAQVRTKKSHAQDLTDKGGSSACHDNADCDDGEYCALSDGACLDADAEGFCHALDASACPELDEPLCGCDGTTYGNGCEAGRLGVSIAYEGACAEPDPPPPTTSAAPDCGGAVCGPGQFCSRPDGECGSDAGVCKDKVGACTDKPELVCGCDGHTYEGRCDATVHGASVSHVGGC